MKRVLADLCFLTLASLTVFLVLAVFIVCLDLPNSLGLDRAAVLRFFSSGIDFIAANQRTALWTALIVILVVPITGKLLVNGSRENWLVNSVENRRQEEIHFRPKVSSPSPTSKDKLQVAGERPSLMNKPGRGRSLIKKLSARGARFKPPVPRHSGARS